MMSDSDKEVYKQKICKYCENNKTCNKDKFKVFVINDRTTMRCHSYVYKTKGQLF